MRQTRHLPAPVLLAGHRAAPLGRAVADAARWCADLQSVRALVLAAVDDASVGAELAGELRRGGRRGSALLRTVLDDARAGARSAPEAEAADLVRAVRGAPSFVLNPLLVVDGQAVGRPDGWFPGTRLGWEVDSVRHHGSSSDLDRTLRRHAAFADRGLELAHVTPSRLRTDGQRWARDLVQRARRATAEVPGLVVRAPGRTAA